MKMRDCVLFEVREMDKHGRPLQESQLRLFSDVFDARIAIRDIFGRKDIPPTIKCNIPAMESKDMAFAGDSAFSRHMYMPASVVAYCDDIRPDDVIVLLGYMASQEDRRKLGEKWRIKTSLRLDCQMLRKMRNAYGYSQAHAAILAGFSPKFPSQAWYALENTTPRNVTEATVEAVADVFGIHPRQCLAFPENLPRQLPPGAPESASTIYRPLPTGISVAELRAYFGLDAGQAPATAPQQAPIREPAPTPTQPEPAPQAAAEVVPAPIPEPPEKQVDHPVDHPVDCMAALLKAAADAQ